MSEKIQEKSEYKIEHLESEDAEKVAMTAEKKTLEKACEDAAPLEGAVDEASSVMKFPMDFPIKVMGLAAPTFPKVVADIARLHCDDFDDSKTTVEYSRTRKYMSVTVEVIARSKEQLDDLYRAYTSNPMVKIVL